MRIKITLLLTAVALVAMVAVVALGDASSDRAPVAERPAPAAKAEAHPADGHDHAGDPAHQRPSFMRTLTVYTGREPSPSAHPKRMRAVRTAGALPRTAVEATVLTDEDCAADAQGVSHCENKLRLPDGRTLTVKHPHRMHDVPCMTPGERIHLERGHRA